jgi:hypothetical protein
VDLGKIAAGITMDPTSFEAGCISSARQGEALAARITGSFSAMSTNVSAAFNTMMAHPWGVLVTALGAAAGFMYQLTVEGIEAAKAQNQLSSRLGLSASGAAGLALRAERAGISISDLGRSLQALDRNLNRASDSGRGVEVALNRLGLRSQELMQLEADRRLGLIEDRLQGMANASERAALRQQILGRHGVALEGVMRGGSAAMEDARVNAERLGTAFANAGEIARTVRMAGDIEALFSAGRRHVAQEWTSWLFGALSRFTGPAGDIVRQFVQMTGPIAQQQNESIERQDRVNALMEQLRRQRSEAGLAGPERQVQEIEDLGASIEVLTTARRQALLIESEQRRVQSQSPAVRQRIEQERLNVALRDGVLTLQEYIEATGNLADAEDRRNHDQHIAQGVQAGSIEAARLYNQALVSDASDNRDPLRNLDETAREQVTYLRLIEEQQRQLTEFWGGNNPF